MANLITKKNGNVTTLGVVGDGGSLTIIGVSATGPTTSYFTVAGDHSDLSGTIGVAGANDGEYTVVSATFDTDHTDIVVSESIPSSVVTGTIGVLDVSAFPITAISTGSKTFTIAGDHSTLSGKLEVVGSNDGVYTITAATYNDPNTDITVAEAIPSSAAEGVLYNTFVPGPGDDLHVAHIPRGSPTISLDRLYLQNTKGDFTCGISSSISVYVDFSGTSYKFNWGTVSNGIMGLSGSSFDFNNGGSTLFNIQAGTVSCSSVSLGDYPGIHIFSGGTLSCSGDITVGACYTLVRNGFVTASGDVTTGALGFAIAWADGTGAYVHSSGDVEIGNALSLVYGAAANVSAVNITTGALNNFTAQGASVSASGNVRTGDVSNTWKESGDVTVTGSITTGSLGQTFSLMGNVSAASINTGDISTGHFSDQSTVSVSGAILTGLIANSFATNSSDIDAGSITTGGVGGDFANYASVNASSITTGQISGNFACSGAPVSVSGAILLDSCNCLCSSASIGASSITVTGFAGPLSTSSGYVSCNSIVVGSSSDVCTGGATLIAPVITINGGIGSFASNFSTVTATTSITTGSIGSGDFCNTATVSAGSITTGALVYAFLNIQGGSPGVSATGPIHITGYIGTNFCSQGTVSAGSNSITIDGGVDVFCSDGNVYCGNVTISGGINKFAFNPGATAVVEAGNIIIGSVGSGFAVNNTGSEITVTASSICVLGSMSGDFASNARVSAPTISLGAATLQSRVAAASDVAYGVPRWLGASGADVGTRQSGINGSGILGML